LHANLWLELCPFLNLCDSEWFFECFSRFLIFVQKIHPFRSTHLSYLNIKGLNLMLKY
jgi:hypothetical protein